MSLTFWLLITALHALLLVLLVRFRRQDHPWLLVYYCGQWVADAVAFLVTPKPHAGLALLDAFGSSSWARFTGATLQLLSWLTFWILPVLAAIRLQRHRIPLAVWVAVGAILAGTTALLFSSLDQRIPKSTFHFFLHYLIEPALLLAGIGLLIRHIQRSYRAGSPLDLLVLALGLEQVNLLMKLVFALSPSLAFDRRFSAVYHLTSLAAFFGYYLFRRLRLRPVHAG